MKSLVIHKPNDPIDFLIKKLNEPENKIIFLVGPPGSLVKEIGLELEINFKYPCVSVGDLLRKEVSKKSEQGQHIEDSIKNFNYVKDEIVINLVNKYLEGAEKKNIILEGFPKTRVQGLALQRAGVIPNTFIILNMSEEKIRQCCLHKLQNSDGQYSHLSESEKQELAKNHALE